jgi:hypothetical protein
MQCGTQAERAIRARNCTQGKPATSTEISPHHIMQTGLGFWASKTLLSAVELGVFTGLAQGCASSRCPDPTRS